MGSQRSTEHRLLHIRVPAEYHRALRLRAANRDVSVQRYVQSILKVVLTKPRSNPH